jgi:hypothetical protein
MQLSTLQYLADELAARALPVYLTRAEQFRSKQLRNTAAAALVEEVYAKLEGRDHCWNINIQLPDGLETDQIRISIDDALHFNRYRAQTLQSSFYEEREEMPWVEAYRRHCRSAERDCLKDGSRQGVWSNPEAEKHFGPAQEAGDFFGLGSPGWRLKAFRDFLTDIYLNQGRQSFKRISIYDRLMVQGKLLPLQQLLQSRSGENQQYLFKYLSRQLGYMPEQPGNTG